MYFYYISEDLFAMHNLDIFFQVFCKKSFKEIKSESGYDHNNKYSWKALLWNTSFMYFLRDRYDFFGQEINKALKRKFSSFKMKRNVCFVT